MQLHLLLHWSGTGDGGARFAFAAASRASLLAKRSELVEMRNVFSATEKKWKKLQFYLPCQLSRIEKEEMHFTFPLLGSLFSLLAASRQIRIRLVNQGTVGW